MLDAHQAKRPRLGPGGEQGHGGGRSIIALGEQTLATLGNQNQMLLADQEKFVAAVLAADDAKNEEKLTSLIASALCALCRGRGGGVDCGVCGRLCAARTRRQQR